MCPCHSQNLYSQCCQKLHKGTFPANALELMRSRYAAYALNKPDYIIQTTHPAHSEFQNDHFKWTHEISLFCKTTQFKGLDILEFIDGSSNASVTFRAHLYQDVQEMSFIEKSVFKKLHERWLYYSGAIIKPLIACKSTVT